MTAQAAGSSRTFRVFVSSTFNDFIEERNALQRYVFPRLAELCASRQGRFQAIDLRWGVSEEAGLDQRAVAICLDEIARCQRLTPRPNFIVLLGDRYGWRPLPSQIEKAEFEAIRAKVPDAGGARAGAPDSDRALLGRWYRLDENAVSAEYVLLPREVDVPEGATAEARTAAQEAEEKLWPAIEARMRAILLAAIEALGWKADDPRRAKYVASATEQEIVRGALEAKEAAEHVFAFERTILTKDGKPLADNAPADGTARSFIDETEAGGAWAPDKDAHGRLVTLKGKLSGLLGKKVLPYKATWSGSGITLDHIGALPEKLDDCLMLIEKTDLPHTLCNDVWQNLATMILGQLEKLATQEAVEAEVAAHERFGAERSRIFIGRDEPLAAIAKYLSADEHQPLAVIGEPGSGKSALMAKAVEQAEAAHSKAFTVVRFIGATPGSSDGRTLLGNLCRQITREYGADESTVPTEYNDLAVEFGKRLELATAQRPLIVFLDALDQLGATDPARALSWLPSVLPDNVRLVVSALPGDCEGALKAKRPEPARVELTAMKPSEAEELLGIWLKAAGRKLQPGQSKEVLGKFAECGWPLYLRLAFEEARLWASYDEPAQNVLQKGIPALTRGNLFARLAEPASHGKMLVSHALGYLAASRYGLSEDELIDVLSADEAVKADFLARSPRSPKVDRLPVVVWSRLYFDLEPYLAEHGGDGTTLLAFYHNQLREAAAGEYLGEGEGPARHAALAVDFRAKADPAADRTWSGGSVRGLGELPYHLVGAERWQDVYDTLTDFRFLEQKAATVGRITRGEDDRRTTSFALPERKVSLRGPRERIVDGYGMTMHAGPFRLQEDYVGALSAWPTSELATDPSRAASSVSPLTQERQVLQTFAEALQREAHVLAYRPDLVWQQMFNRLHWETSSAVEALLDDALQRGLVTRQTDSRPWLLQANRVMESRQLLRTLTAGQGKINACRFNPVGKEILSAGEDGTLLLWDSGTGELLAVLGSGSVDALCCAFSPNGQVMASGHIDGTIRLWGTAGYGLEAVIETAVGAVLACAFSQDARKILVGGADGYLVLFDTADGRPILRVASPGGEILCCDLSADARRAISGSASGELTAWVLEKGHAEPTVLGSHAAANSCRFSQDGEWMVTAHSDGTIRLFGADAGKELWASRGHDDEVTTCDISPDGQMIATGGMDGVVRTWRASSGEAILDLRGHSAWINACSFDSTSRYVVSGSADETLKIWDVSPRAPSLAGDGHEAGIVCCAFAASGKWLATGSADNTVRVWDVKNQKTLSVLQHSSPIGCVSFSPDENLVAAGGVDNLAHLWDWTAARNLGEFRGHVGDVNACLFTSDGKRVITASLDRTIRIWDTQTQAEIAKLTGHAAGVESCDLSRNDELLVSSSIDGTLRVWDLARPSAIAILNGHTGAVPHCRISPDGTKIASASFDRTIKIWEISTGHLLHTLAGHAAGVRACAFNQDGSLVASADWDKTVHVWDWTAEKEIARYPALGNLLCCEFSPLEDVLAAGDEWGNLYLLQLIDTAKSLSH